MQLYSTKNPSTRVGLEEAVFKGLPEDNGLYMPVEIPKLPAGFIKNLKDYPFEEIAFRVALKMIGKSIPEGDLKGIIERAVNFPAPVVNLSERMNVLELFHGPSLAFKDFGARFMAETMSYFLRGQDKELTILVATSGDTGGAVAAGFYKTPGINVVILYPSGKVSGLQEKQLTTLGHNIKAIEINGTFDDCQALVKQAFLDESLRSQINLSSANSINIARLIPQSFYYFEAYKQVKQPRRSVVFSIPSGNFGNLTAGLFAKRMGLPVKHFIAATNINDMVPAYLSTGRYEARPSQPTISNAMDVGNPSNFARMLDLYGSTWNTIKEDIKGFSFTDEATKKAITEVKNRFNYTIDPHGAVGYLALKSYLKTVGKADGIILETAHPSKFPDEVERCTGQPVVIPERLAILADRKKESVLMNPDFNAFKSWLSANY